MLLFYIPNNFQFLRICTIFIENTYIKYINNECKLIPCINLYCKTIQIQEIHTSIKIKILEINLQSATLVVLLKTIFQYNFN